MKKSNIVKNSTVSGNSFLLSVAIMLPFLMLLTPLPPPMPFSISSAAFASHGSYYHDDQSILDAAKNSYSNNHLGPQGEQSGLIGNMISQQQSPHADARNVNVDNKVIIEGCEDGEVIINDNDQLIQTNTQSFNQEANNQVGEQGEGDDLGLIGNMISQQQSPHADARNVNVDNKVIVVEGDCDEIVINDNDQTIQTNTQSFNQEANNQIEEEDDDDDG